MLPQLLKAGDLAAWVEALMAESRVAAPVLKETSVSDPTDLKFGWAYVEDPADVRLDYTVTVLGPKQFLWPPRQKLVRYDLEGDACPTALIDHESQVLFGVHPCDLTAIGTLDAAFAKDVADPHYLARRSDTAIVGLDCGAPCDESSFCLDMGSLYPASGFDVMLTPVNDEYFVEVATERGQALVEAAKVRSATKQDMEMHQAFAEEKRSNFHYKLPYEVKYLPEVLDQSYDSLVWEAIARRCFSCGSCNTTCPTCYCFDVYDAVEVDLTKGCRTRRYDSCQLDPFAEVAGGENFREERWSRLRHRMFRKGKYILEQTGRPGCVGCGRCERACVAKISIKDTYVQIAGSR
ncbi:MAG TPA: 4Fe-4S dicluster domain-containing protein [Phycisphaerae bacterium]|nr:4Fe-4S dicluster domain-containing protein [Phycisphaerae bacterium]